jgi:phosphoribosylformylglycinamidine cyclo-ligase
MGSNGLTSARHDVFHHYLAKKYPESYDPAMPESVVYSGSYKLTDAIEKLGVDAGKLVLSPTRTYAPVMKKIFENYRSEIHGLIHCSGGAQTKILNFVNHLHIIKDNMFEIPALFKIIQEESGTAWDEMYKVFNMGHRMEIYTKPEMAKDIIEISNSFGIDAQMIGHCEKSDSKKLTIKSEFGAYHYQ